MLRTVKLQFEGCWPGNCDDFAEMERSAWIYAGQAAMVISGRGAGGGLAEAEATNVAPGMGSATAGPAAPARSRLHTSR